MYIRAENQSAHDNFWRLIRTGLTCQKIDAPIELQSGEGVDFWQNGDLVLSQTCGMPYRLHLHDKVQLIGTPDYGINGCPKGYYNSVFIVNTIDDRSDIADFANAKLAVNSEISQSGYSAPQSEAKKQGFQFENIVLSHGHVTSAKMVATGQADIAAIDAVTWKNIKKYDDFTRNIKIIAQTPPTPGLPFICALGQNKAGITQAVEAAIETLTDDDRDSLGITSLISIPAADYLAVENP
jgi:ABC-type phosphate/phosphonate transport system substrate-binding protein